MLFVVHILQERSFTGETCTTDEDGNETCEKTTSFELATYWININLASMILFFCFYLSDFSRGFIEQCRGKVLAKKTTKPLGGYADDDPSRILQNRESIYNLAFMVNLSTKKFEEMDVDEEIRPTRFQ